VDIHVTQFNLQLYFKQAILDTGRLKSAFSESEGSSASRMQQTLSAVRQFVTTLMHEMEAAAKGN